MKILQTTALLVSKFYQRRFNLWEKQAVRLQKRTFRTLIKKGQKTAFGKAHNFDKIKNYEDFKKNVPLRSYEDFKPYIDRLKGGEQAVLWPNKTIYFAKTSGTTSGAKYIPITKDSIKNHINATRLALLMYIAKTKRTGFLDGKLMFISGSPRLNKENNFLCGRLSGIVNHHIPGFLQRKQLPGYETNCIPVWEEKVSAITEETHNENLTLIGGIPPWVEMYFETLLKKTKKNNVAEVFKNLSLFVHGGVSFTPYKERFKKIIGKDIDLLETYPASEGFIAFQDCFPSEGLTLIPDMGIFFEFIPADDFGKKNAKRISLADVETDVNYVVIINSNAGLWGYNIEDTVSFLSKNPYRLVVSGRIKQFISAFGEHVIAEEVEGAINEACKKTGTEVLEFTVAPLTDNADGLPCHEWFIAFNKEPESLESFGKILDDYMQSKNPYYNDLVEGKILQPLIIKKVQKNAFIEYMKSIGKLGEQNKVPHLKNNRSTADALTDFII